MENPLPVYQHPALTVLLDDSQSFLDSIEFQLGAHMECKAFNEPLSAMAWLRQTWQRYEEAKRDGSIRVGYDEDGDSLERRNVSIYLDRIYRMVSDRVRFRIPAVLVVDYAMPHQMNGVDFCMAIKEIPCKKILLTGQADENIAIDAFNRKLIDRFLRKSDASALESLGREITLLQRDFFNEQGRTLKELLARHTYGFLSDPSVGALVDEIKTRYRFVEHYLFPNPPGVLLLDEVGRGTLMVIETEEGLTAQMEIARDQKAPPELLLALAQRQLVPFFSDTGGMYLGDIVGSWLQYCLPAQVCLGREKYYWALFDLPRHYLHEPVYSFAEFMMDKPGGLRGGAD